MNNDALQKFKIQNSKFKITMTAPTHILAGTVFTGIMCSFYNINLFQKTEYIIICALLSILPDIDTTKSLVGKIFYPLAWFIGRRFGHRTLTHSLIFVLTVWTLLTAMTGLEIITDPGIIKISLFALVSHIIIDMLTLQGVPFFYPFMRNACVIPGNPAYRFRTGDFKHEMIVCGISGLLCFTLQPLFANGFWTSYNRAFGTVQHVHRENNNTEYYTICEYSYIENARLREGEALVIESKENELVLFTPKSPQSPDNSSNPVFRINSDNAQIKINHTKPRISAVKKQYTATRFFNITLDSLQSILDGELCSGLIQSNYNVRYTEDAITYNTNFIQFTFKYSFRIHAMTDSVKTSASTQLKKLYAAKLEHENRFKKQHAQWQKHSDRISELESILRDAGADALPLYERDKFQKELIHLKQTQKEQPAYEPDLTTAAEIENIEKSISERRLLFSGHLTIYHFNDSDKDNDKDNDKEL
jgi:inner membrane protein